MESILSQYASKTKLAGFRKGKAPKDLVQKMFLQEIRKDTLESLVPKALESELKDTGVRMVSVPIIEDAGYGEDETLTAKVSFEVLPEFRSSGIQEDPSDAGERPMSRKRTLTGLSENYRKGRSNTCLRTEEVSSTEITSSWKYRAAI